MTNKQRVLLFELNELNREYLINTYIEDKLLELIVLDENSNNRKSKIVSIGLETFHGLRKLEKLSLSNNEIEKLDGNVFEGLSNLLELKLNKNKLNTIDSNTFKGLAKLERLYLEDNEISEIVDKAFESLSNLKNLYLSNNKLTRINSKTFKGIGDKLEGLFLSYNEITEIESKSFEDFSNLKNLTLVNNKLRVVDSNTFKGLKNLEKLSLAKNEIDEFKVDAFEGLFSLKELWLNNNRLKRIDSNTFKDVTELETISFKENEIEEIESNTFEHLSNLKELRLSNNKLKRIDPNTFKGLEKLKRLELDYNEIEEIDDRLFHGLLNLKLLFLNNNRLKRIERECFEPLKSIKIIQLFDNQLKILSFVSTSNKVFNSNYYKNKLDANGFHSNWDTFLEHINNIGYKFRTPKLLIVDYYDSIISDIDIITEELLEKYNEDEVFTIESNSNNEGLEKRSETEKFFENEKLIDPYSDEYKYDNDLKITPESRKIHDYLNLVRNKAIEEVKNVRDENLEQYELNKAEYKYNRNHLTAEKVEDIRKELFKEKFCFLLRIDDSLKETELKFKCVIVITDFYLDTYDQYKLLKIFDLKNNDGTTSNETIYRDKNTYLLYLLWKYISGKQMHEISSLTNLEILEVNNLKFPINVESLENIKILIFQSVEDFDLLENLGNRFIGLSLSLLVFYTSNYRRIVSKNMDSFLKRHNFDNVTHLRLSQFDKDFNPCWLKSFANLKRLSLSACALNETNLNFLRSEISLSKLEYLNLSDNSISTIKNGTFSKLKKLKYLDISCNKINFQTDSYFDKTCFRHILPSSTNKNVFSGLSVLQTLNLSQNDMKFIDRDIFANTPMLTHVNLRRNECKLEERTFCRIKRLEKIELEQCDLDKIDSNVLDNLRRSNVEIIIN